MNTKVNLFLSCHLFPTTALYLKHNKTGNVYIFVIGNIQSFESQIFGFVCPLGENQDFFSPLGSDIQRKSDNETPKHQALLNQSIKTLSE